MEEMKLRDGCSQNLATTILCFLCKSKKVKKALNLFEVSAKDGRLYTLRSEFGTEIATMDSYWWHARVSYINGGHRERPLIGAQILLHLYCLSESFSTKVLKY